jgi:hypothetical protein
MKPTGKIILAVVISGLLLGTLGFFFGRTVGNLEILDSPTSYLRKILKDQELKEIMPNLDLNYDIVTKDEGGLFTIKNVTYLKGSLKNNCSVAIAKDIKLKIVFFSKTGSQIGDTEVNIYEYINPYNTIKINEKIDVPDKTEKFNCIITSASGQ